MLTLDVPAGVSHQLSKEERLMEAQPSKDKFLDLGCFINCIYYMYYYIFMPCYDSIITWHGTYNNVIYTIYEAIPILIVKIHLFLI